MNERNIKIKGNIIRYCEIADKEKEKDGISNISLSSKATFWTYLLFVGLDALKQDPGWILTSPGKSGQVWTSLDNSGQVWTSLDKSGQVWTSLDKSGQVWTSRDKSRVLKSLFVLHSDYV